MTNYGVAVGGGLALERRRRRRAAVVVLVRTAVIKVFRRTGVLSHRPPGTCHAGATLRLVQPPKRDILALATVEPLIPQGHVLGVAAVVDRTWMSNLCAPQSGKKGVACLLVSPELIG